MRQCSKHNCVVVAFYNDSNGCFGRGMETLMRHGLRTQIHMTKKGPHDLNIVLSRKSHFAKLMILICQVQKLTVMYSWDPACQLMAVPLNS